MCTSYKFVFQVASHTNFGEFVKHIVEIEPKTCTNGFGMKICIVLSLAKLAEVAICLRNGPGKVPGCLHSLLVEKLTWPEVPHFPLSHSPQPSEEHNRHIFGKPKTWPSQGKKKNYH